MELPSGRQTMMKLTTSHFPHESFVPGSWAQPCETWGEYLTKEKARIESSKGRIATIRRDTACRMSLWVNRIAG